MYVRVTKLSRKCHISNFYMCQKCKDLQLQAFLSLTICQVARRVLLNTLCVPWHGSGLGWNATLSSLSCVSKRFQHGVQRAKTLASKDTFVKLKDDEAAENSKVCAQLAKYSSIMVKPKGGRRLKSLGLLAQCLPKLITKKWNIPATRKRR